MLSNGLRAVTSNKQALMADHSSVSSSSQNHTTPISSFFGSPRFFNGFLPKGPSETRTISPTSILDSNLFSAHNFSGNKHSWEKLDPKGIGLALVGSLNDEKTDNNFSEPNNRKVLFGSKLKIQIPPLPSSAFSPTESPKSPGDFGTKTPQSPQFIDSLSPFGSVNSTQALTGCLSVSEMELSEDYTCVISHGPNPRTTHIYGVSIVESCSGVVKLSELKKDYCSSPEKPNSPSEHFLNLCYTCKKSLEQGKDIYMYRGEKAFCSEECRSNEMELDGVESDDALLLL